MKALQFFWNNEKVFSKNFKKWCSKSNSFLLFNSIDIYLSELYPRPETKFRLIYREQKTHHGGKTVAEILLKDSEERRKILEATTKSDATDNQASPEHIYETIPEKEDANLIEDVEMTESHNDSSVSSASQLLENPSPMSWAFHSPSKDFEGEFTLRRQRGIRRKRQQKDPGKNSASKRAKKRSLSLSPSSMMQVSEVETEAQAETEAEIKVEIQEPLMEAVNRDVKKCPLETDLDSTLDNKFTGGSTTTFCVEVNSQVLEESRKKASFWDLESPKSSLLDDLHSSKSFYNTVNNTPETPLVATVRRCLKYSPENEARKSNSRSLIEIESSVQSDEVHVRGRILLFILFLSKREISADSSHRRFLNSAQILNQII